MRKDKQERVERFVALIEETIKVGDPLYTQVFEANVWAALPQAAWCVRLGVSDRTLRELAKCEPVVSTKTVNAEGKPLVLYRLGSTPHNSARHVANQMAKSYRQKYGLKRVNPHDWGCLLGLAGIWPDGAQVDILRAVMSDIKAFISAVKFVDPDCPYSNRYYKWLPIPLVRKYPDVALEIYIAAVQEAGKQPHPSVAALNPKLWPKIPSIG